jgi:putative heme-binding domain-containing protein
MTLLVLEGGETVSGLVTDRNSESMILTDQAGKQRRILVSEIEQEKQSKLSLMPGNFEELMSNDEMASLIGYLRKEAGLVPITNE